MLDTDTKRRIDTARDILVGKVPDPKSQVEQITIALIYKFMDDMDAEAAELGGDRQFFTGEFAKYGWAQLMSPSVSGHDLIDLYGKGISTMPQNDGIPVLFRDIFKNAYLPYRDPETLKSFLKIINEFSYDHSERLGDAFEYLLSVLGSQGDAGQFRTPRHIIDFMVEVMRPKKGEVILDPACGTAGFLISAYKHILRNNQDSNNSSTLTPDEKGELAKNFKGYDISPDMVRLSLVNLYLHGFTAPSIAEYDTLTSEDRWNEFADVILANPPFMSPKGGIKPHKRFTIKAKRSEVLFVDYIAEHLTPTGRAGIIVPEGIIFQSQTAYKDLRKALLKDSLVAVISLPAGVFNPYSGVKTSILILDKVLAKKSDTIAFFKVENDGFGLGAQRRAVLGDDLPSVLEEFKNYELGITNGEDVLSEEFGVSNPSVLVVSKEKIAANGDFSFSGERYREDRTSQLNKWPMVELGDVCEIKSGGTPSRSESAFWNGTIPWIGSTVCKDGYVMQAEEFITEEGFKNSSTKLLVAGTTLIALVGATIGKTGLLKFDSTTNQNVAGLYPKSLNELDPNYLFYISQCLYPKFLTLGEGKFRMANLSFVRSQKIPLPPIAIQQEIVAEIESYQKVIDGAKAVIDNYRPHIPIDPDWAITPLVELVKLSSGDFLSAEMRKNGIFPVYGGNGINGYHSEYLFELPTVVIGRVGAYCGAVHLTEPKSWVTDNALYVKELLQPIDLKFLALSLIDINLNQYAKVGGQPSISQSIILERSIPFPSLEIQKAIVAEIEVEQSLVDANRELITRFEKKIQTTLNRIWGEEQKPSLEPDTNLQLTLL